MPRRRKTAAAAAAPATAKKTAPKRPAKKAPVKPATHDEAKLDFARATAAALETHLAEIRKHSVGKKQVTPERVARFNKQISVVSTIMTAHQLQKVGAVGATANERKLRLALLDQVRTVRDAVAAHVGADKETARAFGFGARLSAKSNADVLFVSSQQQQAFLKEAYTAKAIEAGISADDITRLMVARRALSGASSKQATVHTEKKGEGLDKKTLLQDLSKETTALRKIAAIVFKKSSKQLASFPAAPKRRKAKRKAKPAAAAPAAAAQPSNGVVVTPVAAAALSTVTKG